MTNDIIPILGGDGSIEDDDWIPLDALKEPEPVQKFTNFFREHIKGQDRAIRYLARRMTLMFAGMHDRQKPIFVGLLAGPSGVGKTLTAETMAEYLFGSPRAFIKISCAEYHESHKISALIGSPPGYIGFWNPAEGPGDRGSEPILSQKNIDRYGFNALRSSAAGGAAKDAEKLRKSLEKEAKEIKIKIEAFFNDDGKGKKDKKNKETLELTESELEKLSLRYDEIMHKLSQFNYNPAANYFSVILFDEIEKANESLHRLLLEIMDKGQLTLSNGMTTSFRNSFIFLTSNAGSSDISDVLEDKTLGFKAPQNKFSETDQKVYEAAVKGVREKFPPEFIGRLGKNIIVFRPLPRKVLNEILILYQANFNRQLVLASRVPVLIRVDQALKDFIVDKTLKYSELGARRMDALFEQYVKEPIAKLMAGDSLKPGDILKIGIEKSKDSKVKTLVTRAMRPDEKKPDPPPEDPDDYSAVD